MTNAAKPVPRARESVVDCSPLQCCMALLPPTCKHSDSLLDYEEQQRPLAVASPLRNETKLTGALLRNGEVS
jgi:hypothetical protein